MTGTQIAKPKSRQDSSWLSQELRKDESILKATFRGKCATRYPQTSTHMTGFAIGGECLLSSRINSCVLTPVIAPPWRSTTQSIQLPTPTSHRQVYSVT